MSRFLRAPLSIVVALSLAPLPAHAQGAAISTLLAPSVRAAGMGEASSGVSWGADPDWWANPALLGYARDLRFGHGSTRLVPDLADDVHFTTNRTTFGAWGIGIAVAGKPVPGLGSSRLSYGRSEATDPAGNPLGTFESYEEISSLGIGLSLVRAYESIRRATGGVAPALSRYGDVSLGWTTKDVEVHLSPEFGGTGGVGGETSAKDVGLHVRLTPFDSFERPASPIRLRVDLEHGRSTINDGRPTIDFGLGGPPDPLVEVARRGWSARVALHPAEFDRSLGEGGTGWIAGILTPLLSAGYAIDEETDRFGGGGESTIDRRGFEVTVFNMVSYRRGHVDDPDGRIVGSSSGWSAGLAVDGVGGFRFDRAITPQSEGLTRLRRNAWTLFIDPLSLARRL